MGRRQLVLFSAIAIAANALAVVLPLALIDNEPPQDGGPIQYSMEVRQTVIDEAFYVIQSGGFWPEIVAGLGVGIRRFSGRCGHDAIRGRQCPRRKPLGDRGPHCTFRRGAGPGTGPKGYKVSGPRRRDAVEGPQSDRA